MNDLDFIDFKELKAFAKDTIEYLELAYVGARAEDDICAMQAYANALAALRCVDVLPDDAIDQYKSGLFDNR